MKIPLFRKENTAYFTMCNYFLFMWTVSLTWRVDRRERIVLLLLSEMWLWKEGSNSRFEDRSVGVWKLKRHCACVTEFVRACPRVLTRWSKDPPEEITMFRSTPSFSSRNTEIKQTQREMSLSANSTWPNISLWPSLHNNTKPEKKTMTSYL